MDTIDKIAAINMKIGQLKNAKGILAELAIYSSTLEDGIKMLERDIDSLRKNKFHEICRQVYDCEITANEGMEQMRQLLCD